MDKAEKQCCRETTKSFKNNGEMVQEVISDRDSEKT